MMKNKNTSYTKWLSALLLLLVAVPSFSQIPQLRETVWLRTSTDLFIAGEELVFQATLLEADTYQPSELSQNLRVELLSNEGAVVFRQNYALRDSRLTGVIQLPVDLKTGWYHLRAYTHWMRNFPESDFSYLSVRIAQPQELNRDGLNENRDSMLVYLKPLPSEDPDTPPRECSIYTTDQEGRPLSAEGFVLSGPTDTVAWISTDQSGYGMSVYHESRVQAYRPFVRGYLPANTALTVAEADADKPLISLREDRSFVYVQVRNLSLVGSYKLLVHRMYSWYWYKESHTVNRMIEFAVPRSELPAGIVQFSFLNNNQEVLATRLWSDYNPEYAGVVILNSPEQAGFREDCVADYQLSLESASRQSGIQVLVARDNPYLQAGVHLPGLPGWAAGNRIPASEDSFRAWLLNKQYPEEMVSAFFAWDQPEPPVFQPGLRPDFLPELRNGFLSGRLVNTETGAGVGQTYLGLTILNDGTFRTSMTDDLGRFSFPFPEVTGSVDYIVNYIGKNESSWTLELEDRYAPVAYLPSVPPLRFTSEELQYLQEQTEVLQLAAVFPAAQVQAEEDILHQDTSRSKSIFYGVPDLRVYIDDYVTLSNLREIFYEVVPFVTIRKEGEDMIPRISGDYLYPSPYPPLVLFDGIPVYDLSEILALPMQRIATVDVINQFYIHGNNFFSGIVNIESVNRDFGGLPLPATALLGTMDFPRKQAGHVFTLDASVADNLPLLDPILEWKQDSREEGGRIRFSTGDNPGTYRILIYGFDESGRWVRTSKTFTVSPEKQE